MVGCWFFWTAGPCYNSSMSKIWIVGNITKDVYLRLDNRQNQFEMDQNGVTWMDLAFDGSSHRFFARHAVFGGAAVSLEVLSRLGHEAKIAGTKASFLSGQMVVQDLVQIYRYILCQDENIAYFSPSQNLPTQWAAPEREVEWIYVDRSANISREIADGVLGYLSLAENVRLAVFVGKRTNAEAEDTQRLLERADVVFADVEMEGRQPTVYIRENFIKFGGRKIDWSLHGKQNMMTHLTTHQTIAASMLGAMANGWSEEEALLLAWANVENANLDGALDLEQLEEKVAGEEYRVEDAGRDERGSSEIHEIARRLMARGKGILAADESGGSIHKKFESMGIADTEQNRRDYRNIFFTTPDLSKYVSGVILFDETARQKADDGRDFVSFLAEQGVIPGVKVDQGLEKFDGSEETYTKGLGGLAERLKEYYAMGLRFTKWRAAFEIREGTPSEMAVEKNAEILAEYAKVCQDGGMVPMVEPEVVYDGDYDLRRCSEVTGWILDRLFAQLAEKGVDLRACILKVNMVMAGKRAAVQSSADEVGRATAEVLRAHVPKELAGVVFLSGGQTPEQATANLQAVTGQGPFDWPVTFSFARALQDPALEAWRGDNANADAARKAFAARLVANVGALEKK